MLPPTTVMNWSARTRIDSGRAIASPAVDGLTLGRPRTLFNQQPTMGEERQHENEREVHLLRRRSGRHLRGGHGGSPGQEGGVVRRLQEGRVQTGGARRQEG